jgi:hypothetical protein
MEISYLKIRPRSIFALDYNFIFYLIRANVVPPIPLYTLYQFYLGILPYGRAPQHNS